MLLYFGVVGGYAVYSPWNGILCVALLVLVMLVAIPPFSL
jgi:hypothetical protein